MGKRGFLVALVLSISALGVSVSVAAVKSGDACKVLNATTVSGGNKYTCLRAGKKLIWGKSKIPVTKSSTLGTPSPATSPSSDSISTTISSLPLRPTSFLDLTEKSRGMTYWAWKVVQDRKTSIGLNPVNFVIHVGPNTRMVVDNPRKILEMTAGFFPEFAQVKTAHIVFFDYPDVVWAQQLDQTLSDRPRPNEISNSCASITLCNGGNAYVDPKGIGFSYISASATNKDYFQASGPVVSHEYFHNLQMFPLEVARASGNSVIYMPDWFREGSAHWFSVSLLNSDFNSVLEYQKTNAEADLYRSHFTAEQVSKVLSINDGRSDNGWLAYNVGSKVIEALVLIKGVDSILEMYSEGAKGNSFENAFLKIYGLDWVKAKPILAEAVSKIYQ